MDVDTVLFWLVWDAQKAALEVEDYRAAIGWAAQNRAARHTCTARRRKCHRQKAAGCRLLTHIRVGRAGNRAVIGGRHH